MNFGARIVMKLETRAVQFSILFFFALTVPISAGHEAGHDLICFESGHHVSISMNWWGLSSECSPSLNTFAYYVTGPLVGVWLALAVILGGHVLRTRVGYESLASAFEIAAIAIAAN